MYRPRTIPTSPDAAWWKQELENIATAEQAPKDGFVLNTLYAAPTRLYEGLTVLADGTSFNPGAGAGVYTYYGASWKKLG